MADEFEIASMPASCCGMLGLVPVPARPAVGGAFDLLDHFGQRVTQRSYGEKHLLLFFGFTHCAEVCPRELAKLGRALALLGPLAQRVQPLYVSVDPARDDPATLRRYLQDLPGGFVGLSGSVAQVARAKAQYRVFAERKEDAQAPGGYAMPHTAFAYFMAPGGRYLAHFADALDAQDVASRMRGHLA